MALQGAATPARHWKKRPAGGGPSRPALKIRLDFLNVDSREILLEGIAYFFPLWYTVSR